MPNLLANPRDISGVNIDLYTSAPLQITKTLNLPASSEKTFATLSDYTRMPSWFPDMSQVVVDNSNANNENEEGAIRICSFQDQSMKEDIVLFDAPNKLGYTIRNGNFMGMSEHFALIIVESKNKDSLLTWYQFFNHPDLKAFKAKGSAMLDEAFKNLRTQF